MSEFLASEGELVCLDAEIDSRFGSNGRAQEFSDAGLHIVNMTRRSQLYHGGHGVTTSSIFTPPPGSPDVLSADSYSPGSYIRTIYSPAGVSVQPAAERVADARANAPLSPDSFARPESFMHRPHSEYVVQPLQDDVFSTGAHNSQPIQPPAPNFPSQPADENGNTARAARRTEFTRYPPEELDTEFKKKYPPDPFGEEMSENARVWKVYQDEATLKDDAMLDGWNKTLDILLIFAGLFSAVATAFIVESYKLLQPDFTEYTARALFVLVSMRNGSGVLDPVPPLPDPSYVTVSVQSRWINGLWVTSLFVALAVALLCILVKQWLVQYKHRTAPAATSFRYWARRRSLYYRGLARWRLPALISTLPLLLHVALFQFFIGLGLFFEQLDPAIANVLLVLALVIFAFYTISFVLPLGILDCPFSTPLLDQLRNLAHWRRLNRKWSLWDICVLPRRYKNAWTFSRAEAALILKESDAGLDAVALEWMLRECNTPHVRALASQAPAALHPACATATKLRDNVSFIQEIYNWLSKHSKLYAANDRAPTLAADVSRDGRAYLCLCRDIGVREHRIRPCLDFYDLGLVSTAVLNADYGREVLRLGCTLECSESSESIHELPGFLTSTRLQVLSITTSEVDPVTRLLVIIGLDPEKLEATDIDSIVRTTRAAFKLPAHSHHRLCDVSCAVDTFCQLLLDRAAYGIHDLTYPEMIRLVTMMFIRPGSWRRCAKFPPFRTTEHIWLLTASEFMSSVWSEDMLGAFSAFVCDIIPLGIALHQSDEAALVFYALWRLLLTARAPYSRPAGLRDIAYASTVHYVRKTLQRSFSSAYAVDRLLTSIEDYIDPHRTLSVLNRVETVYGADGVKPGLAGPVLLLLQAPGGPSLWALLDDGEEAGWEPQWDNAASPLADLLAAHLCILLRHDTPELDTLVSEFFAHNTWWGRVLVSRAGTDSRPHRAAALRGIAHCIELNPEWWPALFATSEELPDDNGVKAVARDLDAQIRSGKLRPCDMCRPRRTAPLSIG
ncbi:hypothetical protein EXIGLDRAFT_845540 [Exidia glandulosa HHB12029]|uniref:DUF6535 domain-containing protein n=1 Tax=Exidia glandulosa HHB12029 TaxID=1314781 RepID=A0A165BDU9_EXIGL|nr:hypothetical protein EXIGLDRAFT_845540 [Exidia glandulosa HHB12029]